MTMPVLTNPDTALSWLCEHWRGDLETLRVAMAYVGRVHCPWLIWEVHDQLGLGRAVAAGVVSDAWSCTNYPEDDLHPEQWADLFEEAGYTVDGQPGERPETALTLYRGAPASRTHGMSWTSDLDVARRFASGQLLGTQPGQVWTAAVEPARLLCYDNGREESEYVITTGNLEIVEYHD